MAKLKLPCMCTEASGSLGGLEYKRNQYGNVVGRRSISTGLHTPAQLIVRSRLKFAHNAFSALSEQLKSAWEEFASPPKTGRNAFVGAYLKLATAGLAAPLDPRTPVTWSDPSDFNLSLPGGAPSWMKLAWITSIVGTDQLFVYSAALWGARTYVHPEQLKFKTSSNLYVNFIVWFNEITSPRTVVRVEQINPFNGELRAATLLYFTR